VSITLDRNESQCLVCLEGEVDVSSAAELKKLLLEALASGRELRVDLERTSELDVTALQLLWAAEREAAGSGMGFSLLGGVPEEISVALSDVGLKNFLISAGTK
jgi:anti-anti-sigma factor